MKKKNVISFILFFMPGCMEVATTISSLPPVASPSIGVLDERDMKSIDALFHREFDASCDSDNVWQQVTEIECTESSTNMRAVCTAEITKDPNICGIKSDLEKTYRVADLRKEHDGSWHIYLRPLDK